MATNTLGQHHDSPWIASQEGAQSPFDVVVVRSQIATTAHQQRATTHVVARHNGFPVQIGPLERCHCASLDQSVTSVAWRFEVANRLKRQGAEKPMNVATHRWKQTCTTAHRRTVPPRRIRQSPLALHSHDMRVLRARVERGDGEIAVIVAFDGEENVLHFSGLPLSGSNDFLVPLLLLPAMSRGAGLHLPTAMSRETIERVATLQSIFRTWFAGFTEVAITEAPGSNQLGSVTSPHARSACFFSGGVDSFFSVLELLDELNEVIFVSGFDFGLGREQEPNEAEILDRLVAAAAELGLSVVHIKTDLRDWSEKFVRWDDYVGSALAAVALMLEASFDRVYIPSSFTYNQLFPLGTHPLTDPLWSTEAVSVRMHGADTTRLQKVQRIAASPVAMRTLRVCWENRDGAYNCGRCSKCVRTMVDLWAAHALHDCETLPHEIDATLLPGALRSFDSPSRVWAEGVITALKQRDDPQTRALLDVAVAAIRTGGTGQ